MGMAIPILRCVMDGFVTKAKMQKVAKSALKFFKNAIVLRGQA